MRRSRQQKIPHFGEVKGQCFQSVVNDVLQNTPCQNLYNALFCQKKCRGKFLKVREVKKDHVRIKTDIPRRLDSAQKSCENS